MKMITCVVRVDLEQKTEPDGSYSVPVSYVEVISYVTKWDTNKDKTYRKLRELMNQNRITRQTKYPRFGVCEQSTEDLAKAMASTNLVPLVDK